MGSSRIMRRLTRPLGERPWLIPEAIEKIAPFLSPETRALETGAGASTIWLAQRCREVFTFEDSRPWAEKTIAALAKFGLKNANIILDPEYPRTGIPAGTAGGEDFDFILIDGRGRLKTVETVWARLRPGGLLVFDNSERRRYRPGLDFLSRLGWERADYGHRKWMTTIWRRISP